MGLDNGTAKTLELSDGRTLGWIEYGASDGEPVLYFHGWPGSAYQAELIHDTAVEHNLRILAPHRPGTGNSTIHRNRTLLDFPKAIEELLQHLDIDQVSLLAVSAGSAHALATAHALPSRVRRVLICSSAPYWSDINQDAPLLPAYKLAIRVLLKSAILNRIVFFLAGVICGILPIAMVIRLLSPMLPQADREVIKIPGVLPAISASLRNAIGFRGYASSIEADLLLKDWQFEPSEIEQTVIFWHGAQDRNIHHTLAEKLAARIPNSSFELFPSEGHYSLPIRHKQSIMKLISSR
jgi:pimeloyl-ACP methyl ester carboxylesterase